MDGDLDDGVVVSFTEGTGDGNLLGANVGDAVGFFDGALDGLKVGDVVGNSRRRYAR